MPIFVYDCPQGHPRFEGVTTLADHSKCPVCGAEGQKQFVPGRPVFQFDSSFEDVSDMDPLTRDMLLDHKKYIEQNADKLQWEERGPKALRPFAKT